MYWFNCIDIINVITVRLNRTEEINENSSSRGDSPYRRELLLSWAVFELSESNWFTVIALLPVDWLAAEAVPVIVLIAPNVFTQVFFTQIIPDCSLTFTSGKFGAVNSRILNKPVSYTTNNLPTYQAWKMYICCLCSYQTHSVIELYRHSNQTHHQELYSYSRYSLTSCTRCTFTHSNPTITKIHTELIHRPENKVLYVTHHRFVPRVRAIQQTYYTTDIPTATDLANLFGELRTRFQRWGLK